MVNKKRLKQLTIESLRGASQRVTVPFSERDITLIFGENGTGKSSIIDGLEVALKGTAGSISDISGATTGTHLPTINTKPKDIFVEVQLNDGSTFGAEVSGNRITMKSEGASLRPNVAILRRSRILTLLTVPPGERYKALASFIDVSGVEESEKFLDQAISAIMKEHDSITKDVRTASDELQRLYIEHASDDEKKFNYEQWGAQYAQQDITDLKNKVECLAKVINAYNTADESLKEADIQQKILDDKRELQKKAQLTYDEAIKKEPGSVNLLIELLNAGKMYAEAVERIDKCPICYNPTDRLQVIKTIEARLSKLPGIQNIKIDYDNTKAVVSQEYNNASNTYNSLFLNASNLINAVKCIPVDHRNGLDLDDPTFLPLLNIPPQSNQQIKLAIKASKDIINSCMPLQSGWKAEHDKLEPKKTLLSSIKTHYENYINGKKQAKSIERLRDHLQSMLSVVRKNRQDYVDLILKSVETECDTLYGSIHPGEPVGGVRLALNPNLRASCDIKAGFCGKEDIPPQAYYSESHIDTLGFVLFLALTKRQANSNAILILDDVFTSVDERHLNNICDLLANESKHYAQIIMTTHVRKILDWVRSNHLPQNIYGPVELSSQWSLEHGIRARFATVESEEIQAILDSPFLARTQLAVTTRHFLESLIGDLVISLQANGPMKKYGNYDLSDYLGGLLSITKDGWQVVRTQFSRMNPAASVFNESYNLREKAKEFNESKNVVNKLVHATDEGSSYTDDEVREFAQEVLRLEQYLRCDNPDCGSFVGTNKKYLSCKCGALKLETRRQPAVMAATGSMTSKH